MLTTEILHEYAPYGLQVMRPDGKTMLPVDGIFGTLIMHKFGNDIEYSSMTGCKPVLRPLSKLTYQDAHLYGYDYINDLIEAILTRQISVLTWCELLADHYNVFNIPEGEYVRKG